MIEVTYEVYRFRKWWKSKMKCMRFNTEEEFIIFSRSNNIAAILEEEAYKSDLGKIRNLEYKFINNEKE